MKKHYFHRSVHVMEGNQNGLSFYCEVCERQLPGVLAPFPCLDYSNNYLAVFEKDGLKIGVEFHFNGKEYGIRAMEVSDYLADLDSLRNVHLAASSPEVEKAARELAKKAIIEANGGKEPVLGQEMSAPVPENTEEKLEALLEKFYIVVEEE